MTRAAIASGGAMLGRLARVLAAVALTMVLFAIALSGRASAFVVAGVNSNSAQPSVALDQNGNAWVAWPAQPDGTHLAVDACEVPAGGTTCASTQQVAAFPYATTYDLRGSVFFDQAHLTLWLVVGADVANDEQLLVSESQWNGSGYPSFSSPIQIGNVDPARGAAALDPADGLVLATSDLDEQLFAQAAPMTATPPGETGSATLVYPSEGANTISGSAISFDGQHLVVAWGSGLYPQGGPLSGGPLSYAELNASSLSASAVNGSTGWTEGTLNDGGVAPQLAGGPSGTFLAEVIPSSATGFLDVRGFTGSGFSAPDPVYCTDNRVYGAGVQSNPALAEDQTGRLHLAYIAGRGALSGEDVRYVTIVAGKQSAPETIATNTNDGDLWENPSVAGNATSAIAVWVADHSDTVQAAWLTGAIPATTGCPSTSTPPPPPPPAPAGPGAVVPGSKAQVRGGGASITLTCNSSSECAGSLKLTLRVRRHHRGRTVRVTLKLGSAQFMIAGGGKGTIHIRLTRAALSLLDHHRLRVRLVIKIGDASRTVTLQLVPKRRT